MSTGRIRVALARLRRAPAEDVAWLSLIPAALVTWAALSWLAPEIGPRLLGPPPRDAFGDWRFLFRPEPEEEARFLLAIAVPMLIAAAVLLLGSARPGNRKWDPLVIAIQVAGLGFAGWALTEQTRDSWTLPEYFDPLLLSVPTLLAGVAFGAILTALLLRPPRPKWDRAGAIAAWLRRHSAIPWVLAVALTALWLLPAVVTEDTVGEVGFITPVHIGVPFEDYMAVVNGRTPLVDYVSQYASVLPLATSPLLGAFDSSLGAFSLIQCSLSLLALIAAYAALVQVTQGRWTALGLYLPVLAVTLFPWTSQGAGRDFSGSYYAQLPNRYLGPLVTFWLLVRYMRRGSPPLWVVFFAAVLAALNNVEFGLTCLGALLVAAAVSGDPTLPVAARLRSLAIHAAAGLVGALALVSAVTLIRAGDLPDLSILTYWSRLFGRSGFGLLPMPLYGLHWAVFFTYVGAILVAAVRIVNRSGDRTLTAALAFVGFYGLLTGQYYAARSDPINLILLFCVWGLAVALLAWTSLIAAREARRTGAPTRRWLVGAFAVMVSFGVMIAAIGRFPAPWDQVERLSRDGAAIYELEQERSLIERRTDPGESILLIGTPLDHRVAERAGVANVSPWGYGAGALITPREVLRARDNLADEGGEKLFERDTPAGARALLVELGFTLVGEDPATGIREWRLS